MNYKVTVWKNDDGDFEDGPEMTDEAEGKREGHRCTIYIFGSLQEAEDFIDGLV